MTILYLVIPAEAQEAFLLEDLDHETMRSAWAVFCIVHRNGGFLVAERAPIDPIAPEEEIQWKLLPTVLPSLSTLA